MPGKRRGDESERAPSGQDGPSPAARRVPAPLEASRAGSKGRPPPIAEPAIDPKPASTAARDTIAITRTRAASGAGKARVSRESAATRRRIRRSLGLSALTPLERVSRSGLPRPDPWKPPAHQSRVAYAELRILRVLDKRPICYSKELERQVYEVGFPFATTPPAERPEPAHYREAMKLLMGAGLVMPLREEVLPGIDAMFYARTTTVRDELAEALGVKLPFLRAYTRVQRMPSIAGWHAERVLHDALLASGAWNSVGYGHGEHIRTLHGKRVTVGDVDLAAFERASGKPMVASVKNTREWFYETDEVIWELLGAAAELEAAPILLCRRFPETLPPFMRLIGGFAYRVVKTIYPLEAMELGEPGEPTFVEALGALGFLSDALFIPAGEVRGHDLRFWSETLPGRIEDMHDRFTSLALEVRAIAIDEGLRAKRSAGLRTGRSRRDIVDEWMADLRERQGREHP